MIKVFSGAHGLMMMMMMMMMMEENWEATAADVRLDVFCRMFDLRFAKSEKPEPSDPVAGQLGRWATQQSKVLPSCGSLVVI
jgi:hypothetical protein